MSGPVVTTVASEDQWREVARLRHEWRVRELAEDGLALADFEPTLLAWARTHASTHAAFLVSLDGEAIGCGWLVAIERVPSPAALERRAGMVQALYVTPGQRSRGAGTALLSHLVDEARQRGFDYLIVHPTERAVGLYRRAGFADADRALELRL